MSPVRHKNIALVGKAAIRELSGSGVARQRQKMTPAQGLPRVIEGRFQLYRQYRHIVRIWR